MTKARDLADFVSAGNPLADGTLQVADISDLTATATELNTLDGITATTSELNGVAGINTNVQTQLDLKAPLASPTLTGTVTIGGTTYPTSDGTEGQVLTTNGAGAVSFADPSGGGSADFVASGAIANGDVVVLNSDGTVSVVGSTVNTTAVQGTTVDVESLSGIGIQRDGAIYDPVNKKVIMSYKTKVVVGTVSGSSISFGTAVTPPNAATGVAMAYDPDTGKIICAYYDTSAGGSVSVGTVSGTSISFGSATQITSGGFGNQSVEYDTNNDKFIVFWRDSSNSSYGTCAVGSVSGTSVTMGSNTVMNSSYSDNFTTVYDTNINRVVVAYRDLGNSIGKVQVVSISGTTPTFTSAVQFYSGSPASSVAYLHSVWDSYNNKMIIVGVGGSSDESFAIVATPSTSTVSVGSTNIFESGIQNDAVVSFDPVVNKILIVYKDTNNSGYGTLAVGTVSGTSISFDTPIVWNNSAEIYTPCIAYNTDASRFAIGYRQITGGEKFASFTYALAGGVQTTNITNSNYIGVAAEAISDTATGAITIDGGVNESTTLGNYSLANTSYDSKSFSVASQENNPRGLAFNTDGTKMYVSGITNDSVHQYSLSTAFDVSTASYDNVSFSLASQDASSRGLAFNNAGTKMYVVGPTADSVYQYSLSTAYDLSTASYDSVSFSVASQESNPQGMTFNNDGTKMYVCGRATADVFQYSLSSAFDLSTASYDSVSFSIGGVVGEQDAYPHDLVFNSDGTKMYVVGDANNSVYQYSLSTAYDLSTASYDSVSFSISSQDGGPNAITFNSDGSKLYMLGGDNDTVYQYTTTAPLTIGSTYYVADDGSLSTTNNGRKIGRAISTTKLLVNSNMSGDEMNTYLGGLV